MCDFVIDILIGANIAMTCCAVRLLWRLNKNIRVSWQLIHDINDLRAEARKDRDEWKFAKMLSDATKGELNNETDQI